MDLVSYQQQSIVFQAQFRYTYKIQRIYFYEG